MGLIAWILPVVSIKKRNKQGHNWAVFTVSSMTACAVSLCMQIIYMNRLVYIDDWWALYDTSYFVANASIILLVVTILLNAAVMFIYRNKS